MSRKALGAGLVAFVATITFSVTPATAASIMPRESSIASFEGHTIDLSKGWGDARACLVWHQRGIFECFRTDSKLAARESQVGSSKLTPNGPTCSSSLDLYTGRSFGGRHLAMYDEGYWQELGDYGFDNATVSYLGGACAFHLAAGYYGQGYWYPGNTGAWSAALDMGSWDDVVSSVYIN